MDPDLLRPVPLFAKLTDDDRRELTQLFSERTLQPNETLFWIGEKGDEMYVIQRGSVRVTYPDETGLEVTIAVLPAGAFFGEISLLDGGPRSATVRAETETMLLYLHREAFYKFLDRHPSVAVHMVAVLASRQRDAITKLRKITNVNEVADKQLTRLQKFGDSLANLATSGWFVFAHVVIMGVWMVSFTIYNLIHDQSIPLTDTAPTFPILNYIIAIESILLTVLILNAQRRSSERDKIRADIEYQINLKAQTDVTMLHQKIDRLQTAWENQFGEKPTT